jgi:glucose/arabinose dehydrogenase
VSVTIVATGLEAPTNLALAPDGRILFTEQQTGRVRIIQDGRLLPHALAAFRVVSGAETGLLGIALDPNFQSQPWVYVYLSEARDEVNRVIRFRADDPSMRQTVFVGLSTVNGYHNGGDLAFGPDGKLYVVTGEAHDEMLAQDPSSVGGKILRLDPDGSLPPDNPLGPSSPVYALGIRNSFGLCFDPRTGDLWETENGPDRDDEVNRILPGANYGWPVQLGAGGEPRFIDPQLVFDQVIVPTGCAFTGRGDTLYFGDYSSGDLHAATLVGRSLDRIAQQHVIVTAPSGITDVASGPNGSLYLATTDSILRVDPGAAGGIPAERGGSAAPSATSGPPSSRSGPLRTAIVIVLLLVLAGSLFARARAGRQLRRAARPPD